MPERWSRQGKFFWALLMDLSKAFEYFSHELFIEKLFAYGFDLPALKRIQSNLSNRKQKTFSLGDLFWVMNQADFASYADNNTLYLSVVA